MLAEKNPNKKAKREYNKQNRVLIPFNTGARTHKSKKDYNRKKMKREVDKIFFI